MALIESSGSELEVHKSGISGLLVRRIKHSSTRLGGCENTLWMDLWKIDDIERMGRWYLRTRGIRVGLADYGSLGQHVSVCDRLNALNPLVKETEIVSTSVTVLCLLLKYFVSSLQRSLNVSLEEHIRRIFRARLNGKARVVCKGHKLKEVDA